MIHQQVELHGGFLATSNQQLRQKPTLFGETKGIDVEILLQQCKNNVSVNILNEKFARYSTSLNVMMESIIDEIE